MGFSPEQLKLTSEEFAAEQDQYEAAFELIKASVTRGKNGVDKPVAIVLGGQPGAGKSGLYAIARERFEGNIVELDCDAFRKFHPHSEQLVQDAATYGEKTNPFVFAVVDRLVEELSEQKYNMIIESSMKSSHSALSNHQLLSPKGYTLEAYIMATSKEMSWKGVVDRYNDQLANGEQARMVPQDFHDYVVNHIADAADEVFRSGKMGNIQIFNRNRNLLYDMQRTPDVSPKATLQAQIQGIRADIQKPEAEKKPFYLGKARLDKLRTGSAKAAKKPTERTVPKRGKDAHTVE